MHKTSAIPVRNYIKYNLLGGLTAFPRRGTGVAVISFLIYILLVLPIGFGSDVIEPRVADWTQFLYMPFALLVFPSLLEEAFFRGILIPRNVSDGGTRRIVLFTLLSSVLFTAWHPLNALTVNPGAGEFFLDPWFLLITFLLGLSCSVGYIFTRSLWVPVLMHWLTVLVWVLFLGGRNLLLG